MNLDDLEDKKFYKLRYRDSTMDKDEWVERVFYYEKSKREQLSQNIFELARQRIKKGFEYDIKPVRGKRARKMMGKKILRKPKD